MTVNTPKSPPPSLPTQIVNATIFDPLDSCISAFARGEFIIVLDSASRENEGDLIIAAEHLTTAKMAFMIRHSSGLICAPITTERAEYLDLPLMVALDSNADPNRTAYTISVDATANQGVTTGISARDRAATCRVLADLKSRSSDLRRPGHVFPLRARDGGVKVRPGHTEAAVDFCRLAGKSEVAVICELVEDGVEDPEGRAERVGSGMMRREACLEFGRRWGLKVCTIEGLIDHLGRRDQRELKGAKGAGKIKGVNGFREVDAMNGTNST